MTLWHVRCKLQCYTYIQQKCGQKPKAKWNQCQKANKNQKTKAKWRPSETNAKKPTKTKKQKPSETKAKKQTKTKNQKPREAKIKSQRPKAKWACKWEIKTQKHPYLNKKNFLKNIPSMKKTARSHKKPKEPEAKSQQKKKRKKKGLKHVFSTLSNSFSLRSSTIITSHSSPKWTSRDSQQACRISASCIFRSSTSLSWVPDSCHHKGKNTGTPSIWWWQKHVSNLLNALNKQGSPAGFAFESIPTGMTLMATVSHFNRVQRGSWTLPKKWQHSQESELGFPLFPWPFRSIQVSIYSDTFYDRMILVRDRHDLRQRKTSVSTLHPWKLHTNGTKLQTSSRSSPILSNP